MKILKQLLFTLVAVGSLTLFASAQKDDQKRPPKNPPVIDPGKKPRDNPPPRGGDKPKKPGMAVMIAPGQPRSDEVI